MNPEEKSTEFLNKRLVRLRLKIDSLFPLMRGAIVNIGMKYKRPHYSLNIKGKTKLVSLGKGKDVVARKWIDNYKKLHAIVDEMTLINIELIRRIESGTIKSE